MMNDDAMMIITMDGILKVFFLECPANIQKKVDGLKKLVY